MATTAPQTSGSRSRTQARKKPHDDGAYTGPSQSSAAIAAGAKRQAPDRAEGERQKRKRVDTSARKMERVLDSDLKEPSLVR